MQSQQADAKGRVRGGDKKFGRTRHGRTTAHHRRKKRDKKEPKISGFDGRPTFRAYPPHLSRLTLITNSPPRPDKRSALTPLPGINHSNAMRTTSQLIAQHPRMLRVKRRYIHG